MESVDNIINRNIYELGLCLESYNDNKKCIDTYDNNIQNIANDSNFLLYIEKYKNDIKSRIKSQKPDVITVPEIKNIEFWNIVIGIICVGIIIFGSVYFYRSVIQKPKTQNNSVNGDNSNQSKNINFDEDKRKNINFEPFDFDKEVDELNKQIEENIKKGVKRPTNDVYNKIIDELKKRAYETQGIGLKRT